jgi:hypothetical protein
MSPPIGTKGPSIPKAGPQFMDPFGVSPVPDAMKPGIQGVRTQWNRGFMASPADPAGAIVMLTVSV